MNPPKPGVYTVRMRWLDGVQETVWHHASWNGSAWHLPPGWKFIEWLPS